MTECKAAKPEEFKIQYDWLVKNNLLIGNKVEIEIEYGNHYRLLKKYRTTKSGYALKNQMTCFVRIKDDNLKIEDYIDKVEFWKHESFANAHIPVVQHASRPQIGN